MGMNEQQIERYSRQIFLDQVGAAGQQRLLQARALIIGMGGLGSPAAMYLAAAGVGQLVLNDFDRVELSNLQRQVIHRMTSIGEAKVLAASETIRALNPDIDVVTIDGHLDGDDLLEEIARADVVLDCCDNFETRLAVNAACFSVGTPLVSGAAIRFEGQVSVFDPGDTESPCYHCLFGDVQGPGDSCDAEGIMAPVVGIVGTMQALEAIKVLLNIGTTLRGRLLLLDGEAMEWRTLNLPKDPTCTVCQRGAQAASLPTP